MYLFVCYLYYLVQTNAVSRGKAMRKCIITFSITILLIGQSVLVLGTQATVHEPFPVHRGADTYGGHSEEDTGEGDYLSKITDKTYEYGKAIYLGKHKDYPKTKYCVRTQKGGDIVSIKSKTLKEYKKEKYHVLLQSLYSCGKPEQPLYKTMDAKVLLAIIYYLDERYRLRLI